MSSACDIEIAVSLNDDMLFSATSGCDIDILIEVDTPIALEAFDWPPAIDRLNARMKALEDNQITLDDTVTQESPNAVKSSGIWAALQALWESVTQAISSISIPTKTSDLENDSGFVGSDHTHPSSAISHKGSTVAQRLDNITEGSISRDGNGNIASITTFGEATIINRNGEGIITGWENDTHIWTLTKTGDTITGWAVAEKE